MRPGRVAADMMDRPGPAGQAHPAPGPAAHPRRARQLTDLAHASRGRGRLWRTFLSAQRALVREPDQLAAAISLGQAPVLLLTDPADRLVRSAPPVS